MMLHILFYRRNAALLIFLSGFFLSTFANEPNLKLGVIKEFSDHGSLHLSFLSLLKELFDANAFVETGTFLGFTTAKAAQVFEEVHTVELNAKIYTKACERLKLFSNVKLHLGDSADILPRILSQVTGAPIFWLDGHYSGTSYFGHQTGFGKKNTPIVEELISIGQMRLKHGIILIDDIRCFDPHITTSSKVIRGYPSLQEICTLLYNINQDYSIYVLGDILLAYPKNESIHVSPVIKACTMSRLYDGKNYDIDSILKAEKIISEAEGDEKQLLNEIYRIFASKTKKSGIGKHYMLWEALMALHDNNSHHAYTLLKRLLKFKGVHWRIKWYLMQACKNLNRNKEANRLLNQLKRDHPNFLSSSPIRLNVK